MAHSITTKITGKNSNTNCISRGSWAQPDPDFASAFKKASTSDPFTNSNKQVTRADASAKTQPGAIVDRTGGSVSVVKNSLIWFAKKPILLLIGGTPQPPHLRSIMTKCFHTRA